MLPFPAATIEELDGFDSNEQYLIGCIPGRSHALPTPHVTPQSAILQRAPTPIASGSIEHDTITFEEDPRSLQSTPDHGVCSRKGDRPLVSPMATTPQAHQQHIIRTPKQSIAYTKQTQTPVPGRPTALNSVVYKAAKARAPAHTQQCMCTQTIATCGATAWQSLAEWSPGRREHWDKLRATGSPIRRPKLASTPASLTDPHILSQSFEETPAAQAYLHSPPNRPPIQRWPPVFPFSYRYMSAWVAAHQQYYRQLQRQQLLNSQAHTRTTLAAMHANSQLQRRAQLERERVEHEDTSLQKIKNECERDIDQDEDMCGYSDNTVSQAACTPRSSKHPHDSPFNTPTIPHFVRITNRNEHNEVLESPRLQYTPDPNSYTTKTPRASRLGCSTGTGAAHMRAPQTLSQSFTTVAPRTPPALVCVPNSQQFHQRQRTLAVPRQSHSMSVPADNKHPRPCRRRYFRQSGANESQSTKKSLPHFCPPPPPPAPERCSIKPEEELDSSTALDTQPGYSSFVERRSKTALSILAYQLTSQQGAGTLPKTSSTKRAGRSAHEVFANQLQSPCITTPLHHTISLQEASSAPVPRRTIRPTLLRKPIQDVAGKSMSTARTKKVNKRKSSTVTSTSKSLRRETSQKNKRQKIEQSSSNCGKLLCPQRPPSHMMAILQANARDNQGFISDSVISAQQRHGTQPGGVKERLESKSKTPEDIAFNHVKGQGQPPAQSAKPTGMNENTTQGSQTALPVAQALVPKLTAPHLKLFFPRTLTGPLRSGQCSRLTTHNER